MDFLMDWSGVDYCDVFISCLDSHSDGTHSLQRIHWWASDVMLNFSNSNEETNILDGQRVNKFSFMGEPLLKKKTLYHILLFKFRWIDTIGDFCGYSRFTYVSHKDLGSTCPRSPSSAGHLSYRILQEEKNSWQTAPAQYSLQNTIHLDQKHVSLVSFSSEYNWMLTAFNKLMINTTCKFSELLYSIWFYCCSGVKAC